jgi:hypothetical protein
VELHAKVTQQNADDEKQKYAVTISGLTVDLLEVRIKLTSSDEDLLDDYPRGTEFELSIHHPKERQVPLQTG